MPAVTADAVALVRMMERQNLHWRRGMLFAEIARAAQDQALDDIRDLLDELADVDQALERYAEA